MNFPCSIILYSRRSVECYCQKMSMMMKFAEKDSLRKLMKWALIDRIDDDVDYLGNIWYNDNFLDRFCQHAKVIDKNMFDGKMMEVTAAYHRIVSFLYLSSLVSSIFPLIEVSFVYKSLTVLHFHHSPCLL